MSEIQERDGFSRIVQLLAAQHPLPPSPPENHSESAARFPYDSDGDMPPLEQTDFDEMETVDDFDDVLTVYHRKSISGKIYHK